MEWVIDESVGAVHPGVVGDELVEFADGSRVWLDVRDGSAELRRLAALSTCRDLYLRRVEPCFGCSWYQLAFASVQQPGQTILARVMRYESETALLSWDPGFRWQLRRRERHDGRVPSGAPRWPRRAGTLALRRPGSLQRARRARCQQADRRLGLRGPGTSTVHIVHM